MAQDWTKMRNDLADDPAVIQVAKALNLDPDAVVGKLLRLWAWAGDHTTTGLVRDSCALVVDHIIRVEGFARALANANWLELRDDNTIFFPKWNTHNSKSAKRRALHNKQVARKRAHLCARDAHTERTKSAPEKRREEKSIGTAIAVPKSEPPKQRTRTPRDDLFDAVSQDFRMDVRVKNTAKNVGAIVNDLVALKATPDEFRTRTARYRTLHPDWECTARAVVLHWGELDGTARPNGLPGGTQGPVGRARIAAPAGKYDHFDRPSAQRQTPADAGQAA